MCFVAERVKEGRPVVEGMKRLIKSVEKVKFTELQPSKKRENRRV